MLRKDRALKIESADSGRFIISHDVCAWQAAIVDGVHRAENSRRMAAHFRGTGQHIADQGSVEITGEVAGQDRWAWRRPRPAAAAA